MSQSEPRQEKDRAADTACHEPDVLWDYLEGKLTEQDAQRLADHAATCTRCASEIDRIRQANQYYRSHKHDMLAQVLGTRQPEPPLVQEGEASATQSTSPARKGGPSKKPLLRHAAAAAACALFGLLVFGCAIIVPGYVNNLRVKGAWHAIASAESVAIVVGNARVHVEGEERSGYIGVGDALAMSSVASLLTTRFEPRPEVRVVSSSEVQTSPGAIEDVGAVILIGGPVANPSTRDVLGALREVDPADVDALKRGFRFVGREAIPRSAFVRGTASPRWGLEDVASGELAAYSREKNQDCALVVRGKIGKRHVLVIAGFEMMGTRAAAEALTRWTPALKQLQAQFEKTGYAEMVLAVSGDGKAEIYQFPKEHPTVQNPRGR